MTPRKGFTPLQRLKIFEENGGRCHICRQKIKVGEPWDVEHLVALSMGGSNYSSNLAPGHKGCHSEKTKKESTARAKCDRIRAKHLGAHKPRGFPKPPPGYDPWKRRMAT